MEERNDALRRGIKIAVKRYQFAIECLKGRRLILDLACGMGYGSHLLREAGLTVIGIDNSLEAIKYARENYPGDYELADLEKDFYFFNADAAVCLEALCHLKNPQAFIDKLRINELVISAPMNPNPNDGYIYRLHSLSEQQFKDLLKDWNIIKEFRQRNYLTLYCKKYENTVL